MESATILGVIPAKAGIQGLNTPAPMIPPLDPGLRRDDGALLRSGADR
ncbi:MAG: hypothetical protein AB7L41_08225 [Flavobacteriaceae bacterium]